MAAPPALRTLVDRYDARLIDLGRDGVRVRLRLGLRPGDGDAGAWDAVLSDRRASLEPAHGRPDAVLSAAPRTWTAIAGDLRGGMSAFNRGKLSIRRDLHLGVGFLAATSATGEDERRLRFRHVRTAEGVLSTLQAGAGDPVIAIHGLGATKQSMLPTVAALAETHRVVALDLPGFGDSEKPIGAPYDPPFFARAVVALLDELGIARACLVGNSMGGRTALEVALRDRERVERLGLLAPSLAWRRKRPWAPLLKLVPPELGLVQPAPQRVVEGIARRAVPGASDGWSAAGVDEFLRAYREPRGRAAFYASARNIYLEEPDGPEGFWTRLRDLEPPSLFVWGRQDTLVPIGFARHVTDTLPAAEHLELDCGHVPQLERPAETHAALLRFFGAGARRP